MTLSDMAIENGSSFVVFVLFMMYLRVIHMFVFVCFLY